MEQPLAQETVSILHELDLGQHTLFIMCDGSIDLLANDEQTPFLADNGMRLDSEETYRLFISLHEQFRTETTGSAATRGETPYEKWNGGFTMQSSASVRERQMGRMPETPNPLPLTKDTAHPGLVVQVIEGETHATWNRIGQIGTIVETDPPLVKVLFPNGEDDLFFSDELTAVSLFFRDESTPSRVASGNG